MEYGNSSVVEKLVAGEYVSGEPDGGDDCVDSPPTKRPQLSIQGRDRLSDLPDLPLLHILSHLNFQEAVRTSILSKRFDKLWNSVTVLNFSDEVFGKNNGQSFVKFVNTALLKFINVSPGFRDLEKFSLRFYYDSKYCKEVDAWIKSAVQRRVKSLHLNLIRFVQNLNYALPDFLHNDKNLVELVLSCCSIPRDVEIGWSSLRLLSINGAKLNEELISKMFLGCPVLETLELSDWSGFDRLKISSASLRVLKLAGEHKTGLSIHPEDLAQLEISGPNLESLEISGTLHRRTVELNDLGSLENAIIDFEVRVGKACYELHLELVRGVLKYLGDVKTLALGGWCIKVLSAGEKYYLSPPSSARRSLTFCIPVILWDPLGIVNMLHSSPSLETLVIKLSCFSDKCGIKHTSAFPSDDDEGYYWTSWRTSSRCRSPLLKTVKIFGLESAGGAMKPLFQFLEFVLRNCGLLQKVVIRTSGYVMQEALEEALKLSSIPAASPDAVVHYEPPRLWIDPLHRYPA